ncbi:hypothetical protein [Streptosporangium roseum]|uniref:5'-methylthioadenosine/S-adenosylhomocysteine nucleosidase family protein n=1 Tax=Streptosporangium roseum TaxID=2001 RepID=UPI00332F85D0
MDGNSGIINNGGSMKISKTAVGDGATVNVPAARKKKAEKENARHADIGVITILAEEARAVHGVLGLERVRSGGLPFFEGTVNVRDIAVRVAAIRALAQGQRSTMAAFENLRKHYNPAVIVLAGIGGGFHKDVSVGDVVVTGRVLYYDLRKETPDGTRHRGDMKEAPAVIGHLINSFFTDYGEPAKLEATDAMGAVHAFRALTGPIGSGEAVIADPKSEITRYLETVNDKILAVDMEAGGLMQAFHEQGEAQAALGWVVVRGISDGADTDKNDDHHGIAARNAATALHTLLPYLAIGGS